MSELTYVYIKIIRKCIEYVIGFFRKGKTVPGLELHNISMYLMIFRRSLITTKITIIIVLLFFFDGSFLSRISEFRIFLHFFFPATSWPMNLTVFKNTPTFRSGDIGKLQLVGETGN